MLIQFVNRFKDFHKLGGGDGREEEGETDREGSSQREFRSIASLTAKRTQRGWSSSQKSADARRKFNVYVFQRFSRRGEPDTVEDGKECARDGHDERFKRTVDSIPPVREAREATTTVCGHSIRIFLFILGGHGECVREDELWELQHNKSGQEDAADGE